MKLTSLFKKAATVLCALALVGMLAACSNGSSSSSDNDKDKGKGTESGSDSGSDKEDKKEYKFMYDDILLNYGDKDDFETAQEMITSGSYTISGKTMTLNDTGFAMYLSAMSTLMQSEEPFVAIVAYQKKMLMPITESQKTAAAAELSTPTDYTSTHNGKVIELTDSGYEKGAALFASMMGEMGDDDDDSEQVMGGFNLMYDDILLLEKGTQSNFDEFKAEFPSNSYTVKDKTVTLNDTGLSKFLEYYAKKAKSPKPYVAIIVYEKRMLMPVTEEMMEYAAGVLQTPADYTLTHNDKVIELTDSGFANGATLFAN